MEVEFLDGNNFSDQGRSTLRNLCRKNAIDFNNIPVEFLQKVHLEDLTVLHSVGPTRARVLLREICRKIGRDYPVDQDRVEEDEYLVDAVRMSTESVKYVKRLINSVSGHRPDVFAIELLERVAFDDLLNLPGVGVTKAQRIHQEILDRLTNKDKKIPSSNWADLAKRQLTFEVEKNFPTDVDGLDTLRVSLLNLPAQLDSAIRMVAAIDEMQMVRLVEIFAINEEVLRRTQQFSAREVQKILDVKNELFGSFRASEVVELLDEINEAFEYKAQAPSQVDFKVMMISGYANLMRWTIHDWLENCNCDPISLYSSVLYVKNQHRFALGKNVDSHMQDIEFACRRLRGDTLREIGDDFGITGEAVRRRVERVAATAKFLRERRNSERSAQEEIDATQRSLVEEYVKSHPGSTINEIANQTLLEVEQVVGLTDGVRWLVLESAALDGNLKQPAHSVLESRERAIKALKDAGTLCFPLSYKNYDELIAERFVTGPSAMRVIQLFGTWTAACNAAGVESGRTIRQNYEKTWTEDEILEIVCEYLLQFDYRGAIHRYDEWRSAQRTSYDLPSFGSIKNIAGHSWVVVREKALLKLRKRWEGQDV